MRRETGSLRAAAAASAPPAEAEPGEAAGDDRAELADAARREGDQEEGGRWRSPARGAIGREAAGHAEHRLRDDRDRHQLEPMQQALAVRGPCKPPAPYANERSSAIAEGRVKPAQAASAAGTARRACRPMAKPTWLEAGPGRNWQSASRSPNARSSSQPRFNTNALRK